MKILQSSLFRAIVAIVVGMLLTKYPDNTVTGITIAIGILFFISGLLSVLTYYNARKHVSEYKIYDAEGRLVAGDVPTFPIVGLGSMILGLILALTPASFITVLMYIIGAILVLGAINQFMSIISARRLAPLSLFFWIPPTLTLLIGLYIMFKPMAPINMAMYLLGWLSLFYGVTEAINALKINAIRRRLKKEAEVQQQHLDVAEEIAVAEAATEDITEKAPEAPVTE